MKITTFANTLMPNHYYDRLVRCLKLIELFNTHQNVHQLLVAKELGIHRVTAQRWIDAASMVLPVVETGKMPLGKRGRAVNTYGLMRE